MVKFSDLVKLFVIIQFVDICCAMPLGDEGNYESGFDQELMANWVPVARSYLANSNYWPMSPYSGHYPSMNEHVRPWAAPPSKRNSELINSLLGLPKNMESAGK